MQDESVAMSGTDKVTVVVLLKEVLEVLVFGLWVVVVELIVKVVVLVEDVLEPGVGSGVVTIVNKVDVLLEELLVELLDVLLEELLVELLDVLLEELLELVVGSGVVMIVDTVDVTLELVELVIWFEVIVTVCVALAGVIGNTGILTTVICGSK